MFLVRMIDTISEMSGKLAAWVFFAIGLSITYEVIMRHFFTMPTIWVDEVSRIGQVWATYLAAAYALKNRQLIVVELAFKSPTSPWRKASEIFALLVILCFCLVAVRFGFTEWLGKTLKGARTDTFLGIPKWLTLSSIWVGFGLLALQAMVEIWRIWMFGVPTDKTDPLKGAH